MSFDEAAFTTVGAVALHGIRTADVKLGDVVAVIGLGLLGSTDSADSQRRRVYAYSEWIFPPSGPSLALRLGADAVSTSSSAFLDLCLQHSAGHGVDSVLIAAQTASNDPVNLAGVIARNRAVVVAVGTVAMDIPREIFYEKELDFRISRSYGPGRYDAAYEQKGIDYPIGYVRWTETRNMEAFLRLLADRKLDLHSLITHRFPITRAQSAYDLITGKTQEAFLGVLLSYPQGAQDTQYIEIAACLRAHCQGKSLRIGLIGAGNFAVEHDASRTQASSGVKMITASAANGSHAQHAAEKFGFRSCTTSEQEIFERSRGQYGCDCYAPSSACPTSHRGTEFGKHVFCEKPLCLNHAELQEIIAAHQNSVPLSLLMVGFNRRFAPLAVRMKKFLQPSGGATGPSLPCECRLPSGGSLDQRSAAGRRSPHRRGLPLRGFALLSHRGPRPWKSKRAVCPIRGCQIQAGTATTI